MPLFQGFQIKNNIALSKLNLAAATVDLEKARDDIRVAVAQAYVQILYDKEILDVALRQVDIDSLQVDRLEEMARLGGESVDRFCAIRDSLGNPVFEYKFLRELPTDEAHPASAAGAFHSAELWYMFGTLARSWRPFTAADQVLSEEMLAAWTSFCKTGNPGWEAYKHDKPFKNYFDIR